MGKFLFWKCTNPLNPFSACVVTVVDYAEVPVLLGLVFVPLINKIDKVSLGYNMKCTFSSFRITSKF